MMVTVNIGRDVPAVNNDTDKPLPFAYTLAFECSSMDEALKAIDQVAKWSQPKDTQEFTLSPDEYVEFKG
jgi:hypothetical protein